MSLFDEKETAKKADLLLFAYTIHLWLGEALRSLSFSEGHTKRFPPLFWSLCFLLFVLSSPMSEPLSELEEGN